MDKSRFIELAELHAATDYSSKKSVTRANRATDKMRAMVKAASESGKVEQVLDLLSHPIASSWAAFSALDLAVLTQFQERRCLKVVERVARGAGVEGLGAQMWLKQYANRS